MAETRPVMEDGGVGRPVVVANIVMDGVLITGGSEALRLE